MQGFCFGCCCVTLVKYDTSDGSRTWERTRPGTTDKSDWSVDSWLLLDSSNSRIYAHGFGAKGIFSGQDGRAVDYEGILRRDSLTDPRRIWVSRDSDYNWVAGNGPFMCLATDGFLWSHRFGILYRIDVSDASIDGKDTMKSPAEIFKIYVGPSGDVYAYQTSEITSTYGVVTRRDKDSSTLDLTHSYGASAASVLDACLVGSNMIAGHASQNGGWTYRYRKLDTSLAVSATYDSSTGESAADQDYNCSWIADLNGTSFIARESKSGGKRLAAYNSSTMTQTWATTTQVYVSQEWKKARYATDGTDFYLAEVLSNQLGLPYGRKVQRRSGSAGTVTWEVTVDMLSNAEEITSIAVTDSAVVLLGKFCVSGSTREVLALDKTDGSVLWTDTWYADLPSYRIAPFHVIDGGGDVAYVGGFCHVETSDSCTTTAPPTTTYATTTTNPPTTTYATTTTSSTTTGTTTTDGSTTGPGGCGTSCTWVFTGSSYVKVSDGCNTPPAKCGCPTKTGTGPYVGHVAYTVCGAL